MTTIPITCDPERKLDRVPLSELEPFQGGLKSLGDVEYAKLKQSISEKGFIVPCFAWRNGSDKWKLLDGHQRIRVIEQEKWKIDGGIPIVEIEATDEKDAKEKLLAIVSRYGRVDGQGLYDFLDGSGIDLEKWTVPDLPDLEIDAWLDEFVRETDEMPQGDPDAIPEVPEEPTAKLGDLWVLGDHRVLCGSAMSAEDVSTLFGAEKANILVTSPPYFNARDYDNTVVNKEDCGGGYNSQRSKVAPTWGTFDEYMEDMEKCVDVFVEYSKDSKLICWNISAIKDQYGAFDIPAYMSVMMDKKGLKFFDRIIWLKRGAAFQCPRSMSIERGHYFPAYQHEDILVYGQKHPKFVMADKAEIRGWQTDVWEFNSVDSNIEKNGNSDGHSASFPMRLPYQLIKSYSVKGELIYEPFCGSGTTVIAAENTNRRCFGMELQPRYVDVIVKRWEDYTGKTAVLEQSKAA